MQAFFTDQHYYKQYLLPFSTYAQKDCGNNFRDNKSQVAKERYFIYNKEDCGLNKHTQEERED